MNVFARLQCLPRTIVLAAEASAKRPIFLLLILLLALASGCTSQTRPFPQEESFTPMSAPIAMSSPAPKPLPLKRLIIIDPGHGGEDFGTQAPTKPAFKEKNLNLAAAQFLQSYLQQMGYQTAMTRKDDTFVSLDGRAQFANERQPDLFVSVHFNAAPSTKAEGVEVFFYRSEQDKERSDSSKILAGTILDRVISNTDAKSRGVKHGNLAVIRKTTMPAVLVEGGFLTNEREFQKLKDAAYIKRMAWGIAQGIQEFINSSNMTKS